MSFSTGCGSAQVERVPAHVRDFQIGVVGFDAATSPAIQPRPGVDLDIPPALGEKLHADANAEKRPALLEHGLASSARPCRAIHRARAGNRRRRRRPAARYGQPPRRPPGSGVTAMSQEMSGLARGALESLVGGMQIARAVIDDGDVHRRPPAPEKCRARGPEVAAGQPAYGRTAPVGRRPVAPAALAEKTRSALSSRCGDDDAVEPAAPAESCAAVRGLEAEQQCDQQVHGEPRADADAERMRPSQARP